MCWTVVYLFHFQGLLSHFVFYNSHLSGIPFISTEFHLCKFNMQHLFNCIIHSRFWFFAQEAYYWILLIYCVLFFSLFILYSSGLSALFRISVSKFELIRLFTVSNSSAFSLSFVFLVRKFWGLGLA